MIRCHLIAPFLLPRRLRIDAVLTDELRRDGALSGAIAPDDVFISNHRSTGAIRLEPSISDTTLDVDLPGACTGDVRIRVDTRSVGVVSLRCTVDDLDHLARLEGELTASVNRVLADWSAGFLAQLNPDVLSDAPSEAFPPDRVLWWHRLLIGIDPGDEPAAVRVFGESATVGDGLTISVGNGYSVLRGGDDDAEAVDGLVAATIDWIVLDEVNRELGGTLLALTEDDSEMLPYDRTLGLERRVSLLTLLRDEQSRYVANCAARVFDTARRAWRSEDDAASLARRVQSVRDLTMAWRVRADARRDERRNRIIWALTVIVGLQAVLAVYDFVTNNLDDVVSRMRLSLGSGFVAIGIGLILVELRASMIRQGRTPTAAARKGRTRQGRRRAITPPRVP